MVADCALKLELIQAYLTPYMYRDQRKLISSTGLDLLPTSTETECRPAKRVELHSVRNCHLQSP